MPACRPVRASARHLLGSAFICSVTACAAAKTHGLPMPATGRACRSPCLHHVGHVAVHLQELVDLLDLLAQRLRRCAYLRLA